MLGILHSAQTHITHTPLHTVQHVTRESANAHLADAVPCCGQRVEKELLSVGVREGPGALGQLRDHLRALEGVQVVA
mgnify:FL=1